MHHLLGRTSAYGDGLLLPSRKQPSIDEEEEGNLDALPSHRATSGPFRPIIGEENFQLWSQIDLLCHKCGLGEDLNLPQIVVFGDQSVGKSSVLEALTRVPFPRSMGACTRFVTQIRLRRDVEVKTAVRIIPDPKRSQGDKMRLATFDAVIKDSAGLDRVFQHAMEMIFQANDMRSFFSKDILNIDISGPNLPHLIVIDLPGTFHCSPQDQASSDMEAIGSLARAYMQNEQTIILAVVSCSNNIESQIVLQWVRELDPTGIRTIGIITKPDLAESIGMETEFVNLALNWVPRAKLRLGWHVLRNRAYSDLLSTADERQKKEQAFFANSIWGAKLPANQLGIEALSKKLSYLLIKHFTAEALKVQKSIQQELTKCEKRLQQLDEHTKARFSTLCENSSRLTQSSVEGHYRNWRDKNLFSYGNEDDKVNARMLRTRLSMQNQLFAAHMEKWGSECLITGGGEAASTTSQGQKGDDKSPIPEVTWNEYLNKAVHPLLEHGTGNELSMDNNQLLVHHLFQSYSKNWLGLATEHVQAVHIICEEFVVQVLDHVWPEQLRTRVWEVFIQGEMKNQFMDAKKELDRLQSNKLRFVALYDSSWQKKSQGWKAGTDVSEKGPPKAEEILKRMLLYYEVVEFHLVDGLRNIFHPSRVMNLSHQEFNVLVGDSDQVCAEGEEEELRARVSSLEQRRLICRRIIMGSDLDSRLRQKVSRQLSHAQTNSPSIYQKTTPSAQNNRYSKTEFSLSRLDPYRSDAEVHEYDIPLGFAEQNKKRRFRLQEIDANAKDANFVAFGGRRSKSESNYSIKSNEEIFSQRVSVSSKSSDKALYHTGIERIVAIFINDADLLPLYQDAMNMVKRERFLRNQRRLLKKYYLGLRSQARTALEFEVTNFLRSRQARVSIAQKVFTQLSSAADYYKPNSFQILEIPRDQILERHFQRFRLSSKDDKKEIITRPTTPPHELAKENLTLWDDDGHLSEETESSSDDKSDDDTPVKGSYSFEDTRKFLICGSPFE
ncbi:unnamed protein product [Sphagnum balticum]